MALRAKKFQKGRHTWFLGFQRNVLGKKFFEIIQFLYFSVPWPENVSASRQKYFIRVVKKAFKCPGERFDGFFREKTNSFSVVFLDFYQQPFRLLTKENRQGCKNWNLRVQRNVLSNSFWKKNIIWFLQFPGRKQKKIALSANASSRLIKTAFNISKRVFWGSFGEVYMLLISFALWA